MEVPRVETERLVLREWRDSDLDAHAEMCADPEVMRYLGGTLDRDESWARMARHAGHWALRGYGNWALEEAGGDGRLIGRAGLWYPEGWFGLEVGWVLARPAWGRGYATEAARASIDWARRELGAGHIISVIDPGNARSQAVARRLGMEVEREATVGDVPVLIWGVDT